MTTIIILKDTTLQPSVQIKNYGEKNNVTGNIIFDTLIVKGLRENRFIEVTFKDGVVQNKNNIKLKPFTVTKINREILQSENANKLLPSEREKLKRI